MVRSCGIPSDVFGAAGSAAVPRAYFGIVERFSTYSAVCFTAVIAVIAFSKFGKVEA